MASFDTSKIVKDIKARKTTSKEPPKYIYEKNPRNNRKVKKLNPRWTAWSKAQKNKKITKNVEKYVKDRKGPINKDLTKDYSKKKESGVGPIREGNKYSDKLKSNKKKDSPTVDNSKTDNKTNGTTNGTTDNKTEKKKDALKIKKGSARNFIRYKGKMYRRGTPMAKRAEKAEKARKKLGAKGYMKR